MTPKGMLNSHWEFGVATHEERGGGSGFTGIFEIAAAGEAGVLG
jgi:hypothetical protein